MVRRLLLAPLLLALGAGAAMAQNVRSYGADEAVDPQDVAAILASPDNATPAMKMRSIRLLDDGYAAPTADSSSAARPAGGPRVSALSLPIQFAFDSANILPAARPQLDALSNGIRMLPAAQKVVIEGHTDTTGTDVYNKQLSKRRADAVKRYLVAMHAIEPARLRAVGLGKSLPLPGRDPHAPENRRVQFRGE